MTNRERRWASARVIEMAREDPQFVLQVIRELKPLGRITQGNLKKARR